VLDPDLAELNAFNLKERFSDRDHLIVCISWTYGSGGNEVGFRLSDKLKISYYDAEIFEAVLKRLDAEKDSFHDTAGYASEVKDEISQSPASAFAPAKNDLKRTDKGVQPLSWSVQEGCSVL